MVAVPLLAEKSMPIMFLKEYSHLYSCMASGRVIQRPRIVSLKLHKTQEVKNIFISGNSVIPCSVSFNPGLALTGFKTTQPGEVWFWWDSLRTSKTAVDHGGYLWYSHLPWLLSGRPNFDRQPVVFRWHLQFLEQELATVLQTLVFLAPWNRCSRFDQVCFKLRPQSNHKNFVWTEQQLGQSLPYSKSPFLIRPPCWYDQDSTVSSPCMHGLQAKKPEIKKRPGRLLAIGTTLKASQRKINNYKDWVE